MMTTNIEQERIDFLESLEQQARTSILENMEWNDTLAYYWPTFQTWLEMHDISAEDIELIKEGFDLLDVVIHHEHSGGFYTVSDNQFVLLTIEEEEGELEWYTEEEHAWISEEHTVQDGRFYMYMPTAFFITIETVLEWLKENREEA